MTRKQIYEGFRRIGIVMTIVVAIVWLGILGGLLSESPTSADMWLILAWGGLLFVPALVASYGVVRIVGWVLGGFFPAGSPLTPKDQVIAAFSVAATFAATLGWIFVWCSSWVAADLADDAWNAAATYGAPSEIFSTEVTGSWLWVLRAFGFLLGLIVGCAGMFFGYLLFQFGVAWALMRRGIEYEEYLQEVGMDRFPRIRSREGAER